MEKIFWFKDWTGKMSEKGFFLNGEEQEIPLYLLLNSFREELEKISEDMPLYDALRFVGASDNAIEWLQANTLAGLLGNGFQTNSTHVALAFLRQYGSSTSFYAIQGGFACGKAKASSDVDILIEYKAKNKTLFDQVDLNYELENILGPRAVF